MHAQDRARTLADQGTGRVDVYRLAHRIDVGECRRGSDGYDTRSRREKTARREDDLVAATYSKRSHREFESRRPVRDGDGVGSTAITRIFAFELSGLISMDKGIDASRAQHRGYRFDFVGLVL